MSAWVIASKRTQACLGQAAQGLEATVDLRTVEDVAEIADEATDRELRGRRGPWITLAELDEGAPGLLATLADAKQGALGGLPVLGLVGPDARDEVRSAYEAQINACVVWPSDEDERVDRAERLLWFWLDIAIAPTLDQVGGGSSRGLGGSGPA